MKLRTAFVRFYKSFNYDYLRKFHPRATKYPWEKMGELWYPFVRIPIDTKITTIVGANESGKSHLLSAIEKGITGEGITREDFCRYSNFFTVEKDRMRWPDFGFEWVELSQQEKQNLRGLAQIPETVSIETVFLFRVDKDQVKLYLPDVTDSHEYQEYKIERDSPQLLRMLPRVFHINPHVALPDSVPIKALATGKLPEKEIGRQSRFAILEMASIHPEWFANASTVSNNSAQISAEFLRLSAEKQQQTVDDRRREEFDLARDLLFKVAKIDEGAFDALYNALKDGKEGLASGIVQQMNKVIASSLNFPHWWVQDKNFQLLVSAREFDLVFTIRDKTDTDYSFGERSNGLKYFLSYYTQYRAHTPPVEREEILLMDEPDAYLSNQAQQDLLKIFDGFVGSQDGKRPIQVIYVTHSPYLIDRNHAERIRVLEKGVADEGTRVVNDAARNHYEPLRSAFGAFVGETTFIGNSNVFLEGQSDQILLAGIAVRLNRKGVPKLESIDLNSITLVPAGSASSIPYLVYLARGRDVEKPPIVVFMDSDDEANRARKQLKKGGAYGKAILRDEYVLQIGDLKDGIQTEAKTLSELEDLIPTGLALVAARYYLKTVVGANAEVMGKMTAEGVRTHLEKGINLFDAIAACVSEGCEGEHHIDKVGFARCVLDCMESQGPPDELVGICSPESIELLEKNMRIVFENLNKTRRKAERELSGDRISQKIDRLKSRFFQDSPRGASKEQVYILFEEIESCLESDDESEEVRSLLVQLRREHEIEKNLSEPIQHYMKFVDSMERVKYAGRYASQASNLKSGEPPVGVAIVEST